MAEDDIRKERLLLKLDILVSEDDIQDIRLKDVLLGLRGGQMELMGGLLGLKDDPDGLKGGPEVLKGDLEGLQGGPEGLKGDQEGSDVYYAWRHLLHWIKNLASCVDLCYQGGRLDTQDIQLPDDDIHLPDNPDTDGDILYNAEKQHCLQAPEDTHLQMVVHYYVDSGADLWEDIPDIRDGGEDIRGSWCLKVDVVQVFVADIQDDEMDILEVNTVWKAGQGPQVYLWRVACKQDVSLLAQGSRDTGNGGVEVLGRRLDSDEDVGDGTQRALCRFVWGPGSDVTVDHSLDYVY